MGETKQVVSMRQLLEAGVHFGHQTKRWNPNMKKFIFTSRNDIHILDLQQTIRIIHDYYYFVKSIVERGGKVLFVGTKKQAQEAIEEEANRCGMYYVNQRWLGGTLTNFETIRRSIRKLKKYEKMKADGIFELLPTKEVSKLTRLMTRLNHYLSGIKDMKKLPDVIFLIDVKKEQIAIHEGKLLGIPLIGVVDTNCDPTVVDFPIPANDDAIRAIKLVTSVIADAVIEGTLALADKSKEVAKEVPEDLEEKVDISFLETDDALIKEYLEKEDEKFDKFGTSEKPLKPKFVEA